MPHLFLVSTFHPLFSRFSLARKVSSKCFLSSFLFFFLTIWHFHVNWNFIANCQLSHCLSVFPLSFRLPVCSSLSVSVRLSHFLSTLSVCLSSHSLAGVFLWALLGLSQWKLRISKKCAEICFILVPYLVDIYHIYIVHT